MSILKSVKKRMWMKFEASGPLLGDFWTTFGRLLDDFWTTLAGGRGLVGARLVAAVASLCASCLAHWTTSWSLVESPMGHISRTF